MDLGNAADMLAGLRIIELSSFVAAPSAGLVLRQLGAEVIRIDPSGGGPDIGRWPLTAGRRSIYWAGLNRGKQSVCLDFSSDAHRSLVAQLVGLPGADAGVVLSNSSRRPWLSDEVLRAQRPDLIHIQILGKADGSPAVDYTVNAETGLPLASGAPDGTRPVNQVLPAWDLLTGMYAALAVVSAMRARRWDGKGRHLTIALEDVALSTLTTLGFLGEAETTGAARSRIGNHVYGSLGFDVQLADGKTLMIVALTGRQWSALVELTGIEIVVKAVERKFGADFSDEGDRYRHRDILAALIRPWFLARTSDQATAALADSAVLWAPYRDFGDVVRSLHGHPSPVLDEHHDPHLGTLLATSGPIRAPHAPKADVASAPVLGEHTAEILANIVHLDEPANANATGAYLPSDDPDSA